MRGHALRALSRRLHDESGIALIMALGIMFVLAILLGAVIVFTAAGARHADHSNAGQKAYALGEAGVNNALSVLFRSYEVASISFFTPPALLPPRTTTYPEGTVTWEGTYCIGSITPPCTSDDYGAWRISARASIANPTGPAAAVTRTVRARVQAILPPTTPATSGLWDWVYSGKPAANETECSMTIDQSTMVMSPLYVQGNLCLFNSVRVMERNPRSGKDVRLVVGGRLYLNSPQNYVGCVNANATPSPGYVASCAADLASLLRIRAVHIVNGCNTQGTLHVPCRGPKTSVSDPVAEGANRVFIAPGGFSAAMPNPPVTAAPIDLSLPYEFASPGPGNLCEVVSGTPPTFDTNAPAMDKSVPAVQNLTPTTSYTCQTWAGDTLIGELSWNAGARVLKVVGTIFIDGSAKIEASGNVIASYVGQSALYVTGTLLIKNTMLCAKRNGSNTDCNFSGWNPNTESALAIAAFGNGSNGGHEAQVPAGMGIQVVSSTFQGLFWADQIITIDTTSVVQGPMVSRLGSVAPGQASDINFPPFSIVPSGTPGEPPPPAYLGTPEDFGG